MSVNRLIAHKTALDAVPSGGGWHDALGFFTDPERVKASVHAAAEWAHAAIQAVREAGEPNPWREASDEDIAAAILGRLAKHRTTS